MTKVDVMQLEAGMELLEDVYDDNGVVLIGAHSLLNDVHIQYLKRKQIEFVSIRSADTQADLESTSTHMVTYNRLDKPSDVEEKYQNTVHKFKGIYNEFKLGRVPVYEEIQDILEPMYEAILNDEAFTRKMWQIHSYDDYTFDHSVRVSMISGLLAKWCKLDVKGIKDAALAGLLHDIGKCNIPDNILNKPGPLNFEEFKVIKTHATLGYILIKDIPNINYDVMLGVLQHHERVDGTGYPNGITGNQMSYNAKIVSVADVYCAMTADRVYKPAMHPFEVASFILEKCYSSLDFSMSKTFLSNISHFYIGHRVRLNNGQEGEVIMTYKDDPARPLIKVGESFFDLRRHIELEIDKMLEF
ncbi:HD-GYP domain-containing protein [Fusibacter ferrireducens]|uniref:HD-GYP domain-containing protein n=1 Tax=Fusibacter ferrireducens TaxID=2785058 RepID=A0ABR9ZTQ7_9FIRM|nr:HD-GYP domain-containing protein [Fusibacter ferrireducens]MBF4693837.1 HD-GYP domain-containing protein [Fusibacter ferrireducens]